MTKGILQKRCVIKSGKSPKGGDNHEVLNSKFGLFERRDEYHGLFPKNFKGSKPIRSLSFYKFFI